MARRLTPAAARRSSAAYDRFSAAVDGTMMVLALVMVPLLVIPLLWQLSGAADAAINAATWFIWALFVVEYGIKLSLAPARGRFVRTHLLDLLVIVVPMLRPLRVLRATRALRLLRLARVLPTLARGLRDARAIVGRRGIRYTALVAVAVVFASAGAETFLERGAKSGNIHGFGDALWWAMTTVTTVGYGDRFPVTAIGRGIAVVLMLTGIAVFGAVTASIAAFLVETETPNQNGDLAARLDRIETLLTRLTQADDAPAPAGTSQG